MVTPLVSVIIPNYNHSSYLVDRIESVLSQDYDNFEVVILDDCSSDDSRRIIESYRSNKRVVRIIYNDINSGSTFKQWHKGFKYCNGEYIWIAESDDVGHPRFISTLINSIKGDKSIVMAVSGLIFINQNGDTTGYGSINRLNKTCTYDSDDFIKINMFLDNHVLNASSVIFRQDALKKISQDYTLFKAAGDYLFWLEISRIGKIIEIPDKLDYFRRSDTCVTPKLFASGVALNEVYLIYKRLIQWGYINWFYKHAIIGFRLSQIKKNKFNFNSKETYEKCFKIWRNETTIPLIDIFFKYCLIANRLITRFVFNSFGFKIF